MRPPSSRNLADLPAPDALERICRRLALLEAIVCRDWEFRYYSYNAQWDAAAGQRLGSMRNGAGDEWFAVFQPGGAFVRGFAHEAPLRNPPGLYEGVPEALLPLVAEPAFGDDATFCFWSTGGGWERGSGPIPGGPDPDGSVELLAILVDDPVAWKHFAHEYHEVDVPLDAVRRIWADEPLDDALVAAIAPDVTVADLAEDLDEIGWPTVG